MPSEINKCPVCEIGEVHIARFEAEAGDFSVNCGGCGLTGPDCKTREDAVAKWNRLRMRPEGVATTGYFGEPWPDWPERGPAHETIEVSRRDYIRAQECVNACAGINPEVLGEFIAAASDRSVCPEHGGEYSEPDCPHCSYAAESSDHFLATWAKLKGGE